VSTAEEAQVEAGAFAHQMQPAPDHGRPGRYVVDVDPRWNCPVVPQGGMMAALAAAAMAAGSTTPTSDCAR
jgi:hypothetical protein